MTRPLISVVTPCLNEEENIGLCVDAVRKEFAGLPRYDYEHIICDNASTDRTVEILETLAASDHRIKVIFNARNFGPIHSLHNGLLSAAGNAVFVCLPADLQDPPELIPQFLEKWEAGNEVVYGVRKRREEPWFMRLLRKIHYRLVSKLSEVDVPVDAGLYQLIDRAVLDAIRQSPDQYPFIPGMIAHCGFRRAAVEYTWRKRQHSVSKATWLNMADQTMNALTSFSRVPLRAAFFASGGLLTISTVLAVVAGVEWLRSASSAAWWIIAAISLCTGVQLGFVGVLGEYIASIHRQVRPRPIVVERKRLNFESSESSNEGEARSADRRMWARDAA
jgi:polyisoprenyl-phosphate glycosyltransferase